MNSEIASSLDWYNEEDKLVIVDGFDYNGPLQAPLPIPAEKQYGQLFRLDIKELLELKHFLEDQIIPADL